MYYSNADYFATVFCEGSVGKIQQLFHLSDHPRQQIMHSILFHRSNPVLETIYNLALLIVENYVSKVDFG